MLDLDGLEREVAEGRIDTVVTAFPDLYGRLSASASSAASSWTRSPRARHARLRLPAGLRHGDGSHARLRLHELGDGLRRPARRARPRDAAARRLARAHGHRALRRGATRSSDEPIEVAPRTILRAAARARRRARPLAADGEASSSSSSSATTTRAARAKGYRDLEHEPALHRGLPRALRQLRRAGDRGDPPAGRRLRHPGGVQQGRVGPRPARDQPALRAGARDGRPARDLQARGQGDRGRRGLPRSPSWPSGTRSSPAAACTST